MITADLKSALSLDLALADRTIARWIDRTDPGIFPELARELLADRRKVRAELERRRGAEQTE